MSVMVGVGALQINEKNKNIQRIADLCVEVRDDSTVETTQNCWCKQHENTDPSCLVTVRAGGDGVLGITVTKHHSINQLKLFFLMITMSSL